MTYLFEGQILHRDSLGTEKTIEPGAVNWMRAGRGIVHSERTSPERKRTGQRLFGIQTWMALPGEQEESDPAFIHHGSDELPIVDVDGIKARLIAGNAFGKSSPLKTPSETLYADVHLAAGARLPIDPSHDERALYTIAGEIEVAGDVFGPGQLLVLRPGDPIAVRATGAITIELADGSIHEELFEAEPVAQLALSTVPHAPTLTIRWQPAACRRRARPPTSRRTARLSRRRGVLG